ncbi:MAG: ribosome recycling factor [Parcubacteria group bacterium Greene0416_79]|nr:MAG: ribosome recycling factor [Parcubacteria group bacterium Greene0416_79]
MAYSFAAFHAAAQNATLWLKKELGGLRGIRATPAILDGVLAESYGTKMPIPHLASVSVEDARTLRITPFDPSAAKEIEKAITLSGLGLSVSSDEKGVRVHFPDLTAERRGALIKVAKEKFESARVTLRKTRDDALRDIGEKERRGEMGEDEKFRLKKELEKMTEAENKNLLEVYERKEKEILS